MKLISTKLLLMFKLPSGHINQHKRKTNNCFYYNMHHSLNTPLCFFFCSEHSSQARVDINLINSIAGTFVHLSYKKKCTYDGGLMTNVIIFLLIEFKYALKNLIKCSNFM